MGNNRPYLQFQDLENLGIVGGYSNLVPMTEQTNVFLLSAMVIMKMRFIWQSSIAPIPDNDYADIIEFIEKVEDELMSNLAIGSIIWSVATIVDDAIIPIIGQLLLQADFTELTAVVPVSWLVGVDIQLPDLRDKGMFGATDLTVVGNITGSNTEQLTTAQIPSHTHTQVAHTHTTIIPLVTPVGAVPVPPTPNVVIGTPSPTGLTTAINLNTGGDGSHNNIQESLQAIAYMVVK